MVIETWKNRGEVEVTRDERGRFISWQKLVSVFTGKRVAMYGTRVINGKRDSGRYEFYGGGRDLQRAIRLALTFPPKQRFVTVSAREFLRNPSKYGTEGYWIVEDIES